MKWHFVATNRIKSHQKVSDCSDYISRDRLFNKLCNRYKFSKEDNYFIKRVWLKHAQCHVNVVCYDAKFVMLSLLTDPRIRKEDYLFFGNDPLQPPPDNLNYIEDLNTGLAYTETYKHLITKPGKQILSICYIGGL